MTKSNLIALGFVLVIVTTLANRYVAKAPAAVLPPKVRVEPSAPKPADAPARVATTISPVRAMTDTHQAPADWKARFADTNDLRATLGSAARAALTGNGNAAMQVADNVMRCELFMHGGRNHDMPPEQMLALLVSAPFRSEESRAQLRYEFEICKNYFKDPLAFPDLPTPKGFYPDWAVDPEYWKALAYEERDRTAIFYHAVMTISDPHKTTTPAMLAAVQEDLYQIMEEKTPDSLRAVGGILDTGKSTFDEASTGVALILAACQIEACAPSNETPLSGVPATFNDWAQATFPSSYYSKVDARAQEIVDAYRRGDTYALKAFAKIVPAAN